MRFDLSGVYAKLDRAEFHIQDFERRVDAIPEDNPDEVRMDFDGDSGKFTVYFTQTRPLPAVCNFLIGEAIHQMRSSLDHLIYELSGRPIDSKARRVRFPVYRSPEEFHDRNAVRALSLLSKTNQAIVQRLQPYKRLKAAPDEDWLWLLDELWNIDKHRTILLAHRQIRIDDIRPITRDGACVDLRYYEWRNPIPGAKLLEGVFVETGAAPDMKMRTKIGVDINFGKGNGKASGTGPVNLMLRAMLSNVRHEVLPLFLRHRTRKP